MRCNDRHPSAMLLWYNPLVSRCECIGRSLPQVTGANSTFCYEYTSSSLLCKRLQQRQKCGNGVDLSNSCEKADAVSTSLDRRASTLTLQHHNFSASGEMLMSQITPPLACSLLLLLAQCICRHACMPVTQSRKACKVCLRIVCFASILNISARKNELLITGRAIPSYTGSK